MDSDSAVRTLGIEANQKIVIYQRSKELWQDVARSPELVARLQDDAFAFRFNLYLQGVCLQRIGTLEYMDASYDEIALMIVELRAKGEDNLMFKLSIPPPTVDMKGPIEDFDSVLNSIGWRPLTLDEQRVLYLAPHIVLTSED